MDTTIIDNAAHVTAASLQAIPTPNPVRMVRPKNLSLPELKTRAQDLAKKARKGDLTARRQLTQMHAGQTSRHNAIVERDFNYLILANVGSPSVFGIISPEQGAQAEKTISNLVRKLKTLPRGDRSLRRFVARENERADRLLKRGHAEFQIATP